MDSHSWDPTGHGSTCVSPDTAPDLSVSSPGTDPKLLCHGIPWRMGGGLEQTQLAKHRDTRPGLAGTGGCMGRLPVVFWQCWNQQLLPEAHQVRGRKGLHVPHPGIFQSSFPRTPSLNEPSLHPHLCCDLHFTLASGSFLVLPSALPTAA